MQIIIIYASFDVRKMSKMMVRGWKVGKTNDKSEQVWTWVRVQVISLICLFIYN